MSTEYLSDELWNWLRHADKAEKEGMLAWLYDEDRWSSGAAGDSNKRPQYRNRMLVFTPDKLQNTDRAGSRKWRNIPLACYKVSDDNGNLRV